MKTKLLLTVSAIILSTIYSCNCDKCEEELKLAKTELENKTTEVDRIKKTVMLVEQSLFHLLAFQKTLIYL